jgi:hypothetical protein
MSQPTGYHYYSLSFLFLRSVLSSRRVALYCLVSQIFSLDADCMAHQRYLCYWSAGKTACFPPFTHAVGMSSSMIPFRKFYSTRCYGAKKMRSQRRFYISRSVLYPTLCLILNALNEVVCQQYFWFSHGDIRELIVALQLPEVIITPSHVDHVLVVDSIYMHGSTFLSYPCHWFDL